MIFYRLLMCLICSTSVSPSIKLAECRLLFWGGQCLPLRAWAWHLQMVDHFPLLLRRTQCCRLPPAVLRNLAPGGVPRRLSVTAVGNPVIYPMTSLHGGSRCRLSCLSNSTTYGRDLPAWRWGLIFTSFSSSGCCSGGGTSTRVTLGIADSVGAARTAVAADICGPPG